MSELKGKEGQGSQCTAAGVGEGQEASGRGKKGMKEGEQEGKVRGEANSREAKGREKGEQ